MNELVAAWDLSAYKPLVTAFLLPPTFLLLLAGAGALLLRRHPRRGRGLLVLGLVGTWLTACTGFARWVEPRLLDVPPAVSPARIEALHARALQAPHTRQGRAAVVILGGGREAHAPEYGGPSLESTSLERLRYGLWLARAVGVPVAFSGGVGWAQRGGATEADVAAGIAAHDFSTPLRWREDRSRDTRENAARTVELLTADGVEHVLLVTHGWHMPRALRAFSAAAAGRLDVEAAPMGLALEADHAILDWTPSAKGVTRTRHVVREWLGGLAGA